MRKILLAGLICSLVCEIASPVRAVITKEQGRIFLRESCVAYGVKGYTLSSIKTILRSKIDQKDTLSAREIQLLNDPLTREKTEQVIDTYRENIANHTVDLIARECTPGSVMAESYNRDDGIQAIGETD